MAIYILVHGACHGGWCWYKVATRLHNKGHKVIAPDLPGSGIDKTPLKKITFQSYVDCIGNLVDRQSEPVILVGHSMAGCTISQVAEYKPNRIKHLIYVAARLLSNGESMLDNAANKALKDTEHGLFAQNMVFTKDKSYFYLREDALKDCLYNMCQNEDVTLAKSLLVPQALKPWIPITISDKNYGGVPRSYIRTRYDMSIPFVMQNSMLKVMPCQKVMTLDTDHSPFFSMPDELVTCLTSV
jgi:pimeloyl-ACP methyl ester carboxylesterase